MHQTIQDSSRLVTNHKFMLHRCDQDDLITNWFRLSHNNNSDVMISTHCPDLYGCQTVSPGWMNGSHPTGIYTASIDNHAISSSL